MNNQLTRLSLAATSIIAAAVLVACGGGGSSGSTPAPTPSSVNGTLSASITDAPACGFDAVNITVLKVRVHKSAAAGETEAGWTDITPATPKKINLLDLTNGVVNVLGEASLPAGNYTQVRLVLDANSSAGLANSVVPTGGTEKTLDTPSAVQSGLKLVGNFDVVAGAKTDIVIDFDACKSIVTKGNGKYALKPVIKLIPATMNGINGFVSTSLLASNVQVSAQQAGVIISATVPSVTGEFKLTRLVPGTYDVVITANGRSASVVGAVPVASVSSTTTLSTVTMPITPGTSPTGSISGAATLAPVSTTEAAYVAAKQTLVAGPTVTIKYAGADLLTGAYAVAGLPLNAPEYAVYGATMPLAFTPNATLAGAGKYTIVASATGYTSKTFPIAVDINAIDAINVNLGLAP